MSWNGLTYFLNREQADLAYMITDFGIGELRLVRWLPRFGVMNDDDDEESEAGLWRGHKVIFS